MTYLITLSAPDFIPEHDPIEALTVEDALAELRLELFCTAALENVATPEFDDEDAVSQIEYWGEVSFKIKDWTHEIRRIAA